VRLRPVYRCDPCLNALVVMSRTRRAGSALPGHRRGRAAPRPRRRKDASRTDGAGVPLPGSSRLSGCRIASKMAIQSMCSSSMTPIQPECPNGSLGRYLQSSGFHRLLQQLLDETAHPLTWYCRTTPSWNAGRMTIEG
jgi:hypothetical protein